MGVILDNPFSHHFFGRREFLTSLAAWLLISGHQNARAQTARPDDILPNFQVDGRSPTLDLASTTLWEELRKSVHLVVADPEYENRLKLECETLVEKIQLSIGRYRAGYLVRVNLFTDDKGQIAIPGGELLTPIGLGREPVDALAEFYRMPTTSGEYPADLNNQSFFFWFTND